MNRQLVPVCVGTSHRIQVLGVATETACYLVLKQGLLLLQVAHNLRTEVCHIDRQAGTEKDTQELQDPSPAVSTRSMPSSDKRGTILAKLWRLFSLASSLS